MAQHRLPTPGSDDGTWGDILNSYLSVAHKSDGTLADDSVGSTQVQAGSLPATKLDNTTQTKISGALQASNNLSDVTSASSARTSLGLGDAATHPASDFLSTATRGAASGVASLDSGSKVPTSQIPDLSGTYVPKSQSSAVGWATRTPLWTITDPNHPIGLWEAYAATTTFNGQADPSFFTGWNPEVARGGGVAGEPAWIMGFEADYKNDSPTGNRLFEWYIEYFSPDHSTVSIFRPIYTYVDRNDNTSRSASILFDIGRGAHSQFQVNFTALDGSSGSYFSIDNSGNANFTGSQVDLSGVSPSLLIGTYAANNSSLVLDSTNVAGGQSGITFNKVGGAQWLLYRPTNDNALYLRDQVGGKMALTFSTGPGVTGLMTVNNALQVMGSVGFYGTYPVPKPIVSGAKGSNAALASLLTALAAQGLITDSSSA